MIVARTRVGLKETLGRLRREGKTLALVPTMGYLHEGHLALVDEASEAADATVVSIFVNPLQFGPDEDLDRYPRDEEGDLGRLKARGVDVVFLPDEEEMYPDGPPRITVSPGAMGRRLCGAFRPGHFAGVLTVVAKLFGLVRPDVAVFGRKDFQQAVLIRRMSVDLDQGVRVRTVPIVREADGLAMSSRNAYLSPEERAQASGLYRALREAYNRFQAGERRAGILLEVVRRELALYPLLEIQYVEVVDPDTLDPVDPVPEGAVIAAAVFCGTTRLIDNVELA